KLVHSWGATALTALLSFSILLAVCFTAGKLTAGWIFGIFAASLALGAASHWIHQQKLILPLAEAHRILKDPVAAYIYTGRTDSTGEIMLAQLASRARLRTALGRFRESAHELHNKSEDAHQQAQKTHAGMSAQQRETANVANAMQQMAVAVHEVAAGATQTSTATGLAIDEVQKGNVVINGAN